MIILLATMKAKQGKEAELEAALKSFVPLVEQESGTLQYILQRSQADPGKFLFYEQYTDKAALDFHSTTPHFKDWFSKVNDLLAEKPSIDFYDEIASIQK